MQDYPRSKTEIEHMYDEQRLIAETLRDLIDEIYDEYCSHFNPDRYGMPDNCVERQREMHRIETQRAKQMSRRPKDANGFRNRCY